jgi:hypothetical protein
MGRPKKADGTVREKVFALRLTGAEFETIAAAARVSGTETVTEWARMILLDYAHASNPDPALPVGAVSTIGSWVNAVLTHPSADHIVSPFTPTKSR